MNAKTTAQFNPMRYGIAMVFMLSIVIHCNDSVNDNDRDPTKGYVDGRILTFEVSIEEDDEILVALTRSLINDEVQHFFSQPEILVKATKLNNSDDYEFTMDAEPGTYYLYAFLDTDQDGKLDIGKDSLAIFNTTNYQDATEISVQAREQHLIDLSFPKQASIAGTLLFEEDLQGGEDLLILGLPYVSDLFSKTILDGDIITNNFAGFEIEIPALEEAIPGNEYGFSAFVHPFEYRLAALIDRNDNQFIDSHEYFILYQGNGTKYHPEILSLSSGKSKEGLSMTFASITDTYEILSVEVENPGGGEASPINPIVSWTCTVGSESYLLEVRDPLSNALVQFVQLYNLSYWCPGGNCTFFLQEVSEDYDFYGNPSPFVSGREYIYRLTGVSLNEEGYQTILQSDEIINYLPVLKHHRVSAGYATLAIP